MENLKINNTNWTVDTAMSQRTCFFDFNHVRYQALVLNGTPARFYIIDQEQELVFDEIELKDCNAVWALDQKDGDVYFAGTEDGLIYHYDMRMQSLKPLVKVKEGFEYIWDLIIVDKALFIATYHPEGHAKIFRYDLEKQYIETFFTASKAVQYIRGLGYDDQSLYAGMGGIKAEIAKIEIDSKKSEIISFAENLPVMFSKIDIYKNKILARSGEKLHIINASTYEIEKVLDTDGYISEVHDHKFYYKDLEGSFYEYDLKTDENKLRLKRTLSKKPTRGIDILKHSDQTYIQMMTSQCETYCINTETLEINQKDVDITLNQALIQSLEIFDQKLYVGGYMSGLSIYDIDQEAKILNDPNFDQIEGMGSFDKTVYFGTYGHAVIYEYDTRKNKLELCFTVGHHQDRPFVMHQDGAYLYMGTYPAYGQLGGALVKYNPKTKKTWVYPSLIEKQSITGICSTDTHLYISTSIQGGLGSLASDQSAKVAKLNKESLEIEKILTPKLNLKHKIDFIGALVVGPKGDLYGATIEDGLVFVLDPHSLDVKKEVKTQANTYRKPGFRPFHLRFTQNNKLITSSGKRLGIIDLELFNYRQLYEGEVHSFALDEHDTIFFADKKDIYKIESSELYDKNFY